MNFTSMFMFPNVFQLLNFVHSSVFFHPSLLSVDSSIHCQAAWVTATTHQIEFIPPPLRQHPHSHMAALLRDSLHNTMKGIYTKCDLLYVDSLPENPLGHLSEEAQPFYPWLSSPDFASFYCSLSQVLSNKQFVPSFRQWILLGG